MATESLKIRITADDRSETIVVAKSSATLGSAAHCDVRVDHPSVAGEHARVWMDGGRLWIQDLGAPGGTFLNGTALPTLKPMLVRPVDQVRLAGCEDEIGFDKPGAADPVRPPRVEAATVRAREPEREAEPAPIAERTERARLAREISEMRLQLQMAEIERNGVNELRRQVNDVKAELLGLVDARKDQLRTMEQTRADEEERRLAFEAALTTRRAEVERELAEMRDVQGRTLGQWKIAVVAELGRQAQGLFREKALRPELSQELDRELTTIFRAVLLEEDPHGGAGAVILEREAKARAPEPRAEREDSSLRLIAASVSKRKATSKPRRVIATGLIVATLGLGVEIYRVTRANDRAPASETTFAKDHALDEGYVDNVLGTPGYVEAALSDDWRKLWTSALEKNAKTLRASARALTLIAERETTFVQEMRDLRDRATPPRAAEVAARMRQREVEFTRESLSDLHGDAEALRRYQVLKREMLARLLPH